MTLKDVFVADLKATLEETASIMADRIILESLAKNGNVSLEEAEFYDSLVRRVITESAEEFVPESLELPLIQEGIEGAEPMILTGEDGTVYSFNAATCELTPIEGAEGADEAQDGLDDIVSDEAGIAQGVQESEEATEKVVEESTVVGTEVEGGTEPGELTESQTIVSNLIKSLGN